MKIPYLENQSWSEVTREERFFCTELFFQMRSNLAPFLELISRNPMKEYDVGFEVCLYRDVLKEYGMSVKAEGLPQKRTFDLVLMAHDEIIIIEAKSNLGFDNKQLKYFDDDKENIKKLFSIIKQPKPEISIIAIHSSKYNPSAAICSHFSKTITWKQIVEKYPSAKAVFLRANGVYDATHNY